MTEAVASTVLASRLPAPAFWRGKKVFLTGHTGFKGSWLSLWLCQMGATVQGYAFGPPAGPNLFDSLRLAEALRHRIGDVRNHAQLTADIAAFQPDIVIHMAAQPLVLKSYESPVTTFETNVMGTVNLLDAALHGSNAQVTLIITTDKCYENAAPPTIHKETDRLGGHDPYSSSKACAELVTAAYAKSFFLQSGKSVASVRAGNVIGGGDWSANRLVTDVVSALLAGKAPALRVPDAVRPWQHVLEPLSGYLVAAEHLFEAPPTTQAWNFGPNPDNEATTAFVAALLCKRWGAGISSIEAPNQHRGKEASYLALDSSKAKDELGWMPIWNLDQAVQKTVDWYLAWSNSKDMQQITCSQITEYVETTTVKNDLLKDEMK